MDMLAMGIIAKTRNNLKRPNTIVLLGDSNTLYNAGGSSTVNYYNDKGFFTFANILLKQRLKVLYNAGIGGQTASQVIARIPVDVLPYQPGWCHLMVGTNNFKDSVYAQATDVIATVKSGITQLTSSGIGVIVSTIYPITGAVAGGKAQMDIYNSWLRNEAAFMSNVVLIDMRKTLIDSATGDWLTGCSPDGLHLTAKGAYLAGYELYKVLDPVIPKIDVLGTDYTNAGCLTTNPLCAGDTAGIATGWTWYANGATSTLSKVARTDNIPGYWQQFDTSVIGSGPSFYQFVTTGFAVGDKVYAQCEVEVDSGATLGGSYNLTARSRNTGGTSLYTVSASNPVAGNWQAYPAGVLRTPIMTIPADTVNIQVQFEPKIVGKVRVTRIELIKAY